MPAVGDEVLARSSHRPSGSVRYTQEALAMAQTREPEVVAVETVFEGRIVALEKRRLRFPGGHEGTYEVARHPGGAAVVALDEEGRVALVRQYRHALGQWLLEIPAGKLRPGESAMSCALRELAEETGIRARLLVPMGSIWTAPGFSDERIWLFLAQGVEPGPQQLEQDELITVEWVPFRQALAWARVGQLMDAKTVCALFRAAERVPT